MRLETGPGEPAAGGWRPVPLSRFARDLVDLSPVGAATPIRVLAVDGRSGGGKSTLARRLREVLPGSAVVEVDDVGWHAPMFGWAPLLIDGVLAPLRRGDPVRYRPPAWEARGRSGAIEVPAGTRVLILEGVGSSHAELTDFLDVAVWVQSDYAEAERRGIARDLGSGVNGDATASVAFWHDWMAHEIAFLADDRPWERADAIVAGTSTYPVAADHVLVGAPSPKLS